MEALGRKSRSPETMHIMFITDLSTFAGFSDADQSGIWANEVRNLSKDLLSVRTRNGELATGLYKDIADKVKNAGGKFAKSIYCMLLLGKDQEPEFVNFKLYGSAVGPWIDFGYSDLRQEDDGGRV